MPTTPGYKEELLEIVYRLGGSAIKQNVHLPSAKMHCEGWDKETFWDTAQSLVDDGLLIIRNQQGWVAMSLQGRKQVEDRLAPSYTTNSISIGTAVNSPILQAGAHSTQSQSVTYGAQDIGDLHRLLQLFEDHFDELEIDASRKRKAEAQIATLKAQVADDPNPVIIKEAGRTLRNITEGTIGGLIAAGVQPTLWTWIADTMARLF